MNTSPSKTLAIGVYFIAIVGTFFLMAWLVSVVRQYTEPPPLNAARAEERRKALAELEASNAEVLHNYAWVDQSKGLVRLPIDVAKQVLIQEWQKPAQGWANLLALAEKAAAPPPQAPQPAPSAK